MKLPANGATKLSAMVRFAVVLVVLQGLWQLARGSMVERAVIDHATVGTAVQLIHWITPDLPVSGEGSRIVAPGGGVNVLNGCEGTEVLFLLFAALAASGLSPNFRMLGLVLGTLEVFVLNQCRLVALFYSFRNDRVLFDQLHGLIAPLLLIVLVLALFLELIRRDARRQVPGGARTTA